MIISSSPKTFDVFDKDLSDKVFNMFSNSNVLAIDTEAMGLVHGRDRLCLVQICDKEDNVACIRIEKGQQFAPKLKELMENSNIEKVFHFARFDLAALSYNLNIQVNPIFCTKTASKIARTYTPRHGLKELIFELINVELDKQAQSSDWGDNQNLSKKQLEYAANDVRYLIPAKEKLTNMLEREKRFALAQKCFTCIPVFSELDICRFGNIFDH